MNENPPPKIKRHSRHLAAVLRENLGRRFLRGAEIGVCRGENAAGLLRLMPRIHLWMIDDVENDRPKDKHVKQGLDLFLAEFGGRVKEIFRHKYVVGYERIA